MGISRTGRISQLNNRNPSKNMFYRSIKFSYTTIHEKGKIIKPLKPKNSNGYDKVSVKILKWSTPFISFPVTYICNKCLELGIFSSRLKISIVKPIPKTGDRFNIANFKPISLLTSSS
jgi:hypothetical protein